MTDDTRRRIHVSGYANAELIPDAVKLDITICKADATASIAKADIDSRVSKVIALAKELGVAATDITATDLSLYANSDYRHGEIVRNAKKSFTEIVVSVTLRDIGLYNQFIDGLLAVPVDKINRIQKILSDPTASSRATLIAAIEDAKQKAETIAAQFGAKVGRVHSISTPLDRFREEWATEQVAHELDDRLVLGAIGVSGSIECSFDLET